MSSPLRWKIGLSTIASLFLIFTILAFSSRWSISKSQNGDRHLAGVLKMDRVMGKQLSALSVQLAPLDEVPEFDHQAVKLTGHVTANITNGSVIKYQWDYPLAWLSFRAMSVAL